MGIETFASIACQAMIQGKGVVSTQQASQLVFPRGANRSVTLRAWEVVDH